LDQRTFSGGGSVARKVNLKAPVKLKAWVKKSMDRDHEFGKQFDSDSMEGGAWNTYMQASQRYEEAFERLNRIDKAGPTFDQAAREVDKLRRVMFQTFDAFQASTRNTITVADNELKTVVAEALSGNIDALTGIERGLEGHRQIQALAKLVVQDFHDANVKIHEDDSMEAPYCESCEAELAA
jgi:hypothetical protein